jgi:hypothetical protein
MEYVVYHLRPYGLDTPFGPELMEGQAANEQFELLGQSILDDAQTEARNMMGRDDLAWRSGNATLGPQIITREPTTPTTTTSSPAAVTNVLQMAAFNITILAQQTTTAARKVWP